MTGQTETRYEARAYHQCLYDLNAIGEALVYPCSFLIVLWKPGSDRSITAVSTQ